MAKTFKEYEKENTIICPNCHINIKVLTDDLFLPMGDVWHDDMYISHEDEYLERKALQQIMDKARINLMRIYGYPQQKGKYKDYTDEFKNIIMETLDILRGEDNE